MKKRIIKTFGLLAIVLMIGFSFNGKNAIADDGDDITCRCGLFRPGCFANGWGSSCAPTGTTTCWAYDRNCTPDPE